MADKDRRCDDKCGCAVPCPGGVSCRCSVVVSERAGEGGEGGGHSTCPCGAHCGCNLCKCGKGVAGGVGRAACACGAGCNCSTCKS